VESFRASHPTHRLQNPRPGIRRLQDTRAVAKKITVIIRIGAVGSLSSTAGFDSFRRQIYCFQALIQSYCSHRRGCSGTIRRVHHRHSHLLALSMKIPRRCLSLSTLPAGELEGKMEGLLEFKTRSGTSSTEGEPRNHTLDSRGPCLSVFQGHLGKSSGSCAFS